MHVNVASIASPAAATNTHDTQSFIIRTDHATKVNKLSNKVIRVQMEIQGHTKHGR